MFAKTLPLHIASMALGVVALTTMLSPRAMRNWQALTLALFASIIACTARIAVINSDGDVLVKSLWLCFFGAGVLLPWSPRWQAALEAVGALALFAYSTQISDPTRTSRSPGRCWRRAGPLSQLSSVHGGRYRRKLAEQLAALAENDRLLRHEMDLRAEIATARERDLVRLQDKRSGAAQGLRREPGQHGAQQHNRWNVHRRQPGIRPPHLASRAKRQLGTTSPSCDMWIHPDEMIAFADQLTKTGEVRNLEVAYRMKDRSERPMLLSGAMVEVYGRLCCLTISREISDLKMTQRELVAAREAALASSQAKSEFLSSISHEIRTPMNAVLGMSELLSETELDHRAASLPDTVMSSNGESLLELINSILDLARIVKRAAADREHSNST